FTLEAEAARLLSVNRIRLGKDFHRGGSRPGLGLLLPGAAACHLLLGESGSLHRGSPAVAPAVSLPALRDSVAEAGAGNRALDALGPTRAVPCPRTLGQVEGAGIHRNQMSVGLTLPRNSVRVSKPPRLNLLDGSIDRRGGGTAKLAGMDNQRRASPTRY